MNIAHNYSGVILLHRYNRLQSNFNIFLCHRPPNLPIRPLPRLPIFYAT
jgi:hypothetical protein